MAAPLNTCTTIEQRGVVRFLWAGKKYGSKGYPHTGNAALMGSISLFATWSCNLLIELPTYKGTLLVLKPNIN
jgi:hypothetical protein